MMKRFLAKTIPKKTTLVLQTPTAFSRTTIMITTINSRRYYSSNNNSNSKRTKVVNAPHPSSLITTAHPLNKIFMPSTQNDLSDISCTIFDSTGNVVAVSKKFPKSKFLHENGLFPRDLRKIDSSNVDVAPIIAVRSNCILINMLYIKALIKKDSVLIFDTTNPESNGKLSLFMYDLESKLKSKIINGGPAFSLMNHNLNQQSYEFKALESILINVMAVLENELTNHIKICGDILSYLDNQIDRERLRDLLVHSKKLTMFYQKSLLIKNVLDELLDNDDDLESMYLTENDKLQKILKDKQFKEIEVEDLSVSPALKLRHQNENKKNETHSTRYNNNELDTGEIEMLLESYYKQCDEIVQQSETLINDIKSTEEIVNIILDANRNSLMVYELKISIYTLGFTVATLMPAFYGMNLKNYIEESEVAFSFVVGLSFIAGVSIILHSFRKLRMVQKMNITSKAQITELDNKIRTDSLSKSDLSKVGKLDLAGKTGFSTKLENNGWERRSSSRAWFYKLWNRNRFYGLWNRHRFYKFWNGYWFYKLWNRNSPNKRWNKTDKQRDLIWKWLVKDKNNTR